MRKHIVNLALKLVGTPYIWGGNSPRGGFDCSGFVIWILQVFDVLPAGDWTSQGLREHFKFVRQGVEPKPGDLVFYGQEPRATHVVMYIGMMNGEPMQVGASGGDSSTTTTEEAVRKNAMVKVKPVHYRRDFLGYYSIGDA